MIATTEATTIQDLSKYMLSLLETRIRGKVICYACESCHFQFDSKANNPFCPRCHSKESVILIQVIDEGKSIICKKNNLPEYDQELIDELVLTIHDSGDIFPDDYRYEWLEDSLQAVQDNECTEDITLEPDIYTYNLTTWLASHVTRVDYLTQAQNEFDESEDGFKLLSLAQYLEKQEVLSSTIAWLEELYDELV